MAAQCCPPSDKMSAFTWPMATCISNEFYCIHPLPTSYTLPSRTGSSTWYRDPRNCAQSVSYEHTQFNVSIPSWFATPHPRWWASEARFEEPNFPSDFVGMESLSWSPCRISSTRGMFEHYPSSFGSLLIADNCSGLGLVASAGPYECSNSFAFLWNVAIKDICRL